MMRALARRRSPAWRSLNALIDRPLNRALVRQVQEMSSGASAISPENLAELTTAPRG